MANNTNKQHETMVKWLRDLHATERGAADTLDRLAERLGRHPQLVTLQQHWREKEEQIRAIEANLKRLNADPSRVKDTATRFKSLMDTFATVVASDEPVKDCLTLYALKHYEIASYIALATAARELSDAEITSMCERHLEQDRAMTEFLGTQLAEVTLDNLRP